MLKEMIRSLINSEVQALSTRLGTELELGLMTKNEDNWTVPISTPNGLPASLTPAEYRTALADMERQLKTMHKITARFMTVKL